MKKKLKKTALNFGVLFSVFALGLFFGLNSWEKNLYVQWNPSQGRGVAGADSDSEILNLSYSQLSPKAGSALFSQSRVVDKNGLKAFYLRNFLVHNPKFKKHRFICQIFSSVEFSFSAIGVNFSGDEGLMVLQSPCNMESEAFVGPFWIPYQEILAHPEQKSFELPEKRTFIRFYNISVSLTESWLLTNVRFFNEGHVDDEFLVRFVPGAENPYFELSLSGEEFVEETAI